MGHLLPKVHKPLVTLYEGIGVVGNGRKPLVIAALGDGESSFLASWRVFDDNRNVWELPVPSFGKTLFECIGNRLYYASVDRFTIYDPVVSVG